MTAHVCTHPGVRIAPSNWRGTAEQWSGTVKTFFRHLGPEFVRLNFQFPSRASGNLLLILQQCMGIFVRNFTRLLSDQIYTLSPSFIEIFPELTKLHSFNHDNPHFTVFVSMFIRMNIQCSLKFEITSITKERLLASVLTSLLTSVATHLADDFFLKCSF